MSQSVSGLTMDLLASARSHIASLVTDFAQAPEELLGLRSAVSTELMSGAGVRALTYGLILALIGCGVEWLYWSYAWAPLRAVESTQVASRRHALRLGLRRLALLGSGLLLFTFAVITASAAFTWPRGVQEAVIAATLFVVVLRSAWLAVSVLLAPGLAKLRLVPVEARNVGRLAATLLVVAGLAAFGTLAPALLDRMGEAPHTAGMLRAVCASLATVLLIAAAFAFGGEAGSPHAGPRRLRLPKFPRAIVIALMVATVFFLWLLGSGLAAAIAAIVSAVIVLQMKLRELVFFFWQDESRFDAQDAAPAADPMLMPSIVLSAARFVVVLLGLGACALAMQTPVSELAASRNFAVRFGFQLLGVAALALFANVVWILVKTTIDHRLKGIDLDDAHAGSNPNARLLTLLPLLRTTAAVLLGVMLVLSSLWALGIEVTPLLAGAGVIGLAVGFGAQALVRDVIAGIFFLAEDVFRVGEYIESGATTKGTVERITLRTVALRHHNGPLHFVPYGSLGTVRNNSRDWVIEKFNLPLPVDVDSEKIRKLIKRIGQEMLQDPDVGPLMREPLKSKLARIDPGVKIFRCKFRTAPGNQFDVRAQAFKRIESELRALGIAFAGGAQTIVIDRQAGLAPAA
jgi:moderate conductance mechanosensitive channel